MAQSRAHRRMSQQSVLFRKIGTGELVVACPQRHSWVFSSEMYRCLLPFFQSLDEHAQAWMNFNSHFRRWWWPYGARLVHREASFRENILTPHAEERLARQKRKGTCSSTYQLHTVSVFVVIL